MKKCVKCGRRYEDSVLICNVCDLYLIKDVASEAKNESNRSFEEHCTNHQNDDESYKSMSSNKRRRNRVVAVDEDDEVNTTTSTKPTTKTVFVSSDEDDIEPVYRETSGRTTRRPRRIHRIGRRILPLIRIILPISLIVVAAILIVINWNAIRELLRACIVGALIGGTILTFLSLRGRNFNLDVVTIGAIGGAVVGCILKYNVLGTTVELSALINALMPCVIELAGIWLILRAIFRR